MEHATQQGMRQSIAGDQAAARAIDTHICHVLRRAYQRASSLMAAAVKEAELTPLQFCALAKIRELGKVSQNHLGRLVAMDPATNQGVIQRLNDKGLIARESDPDDRRRTLLSLTEAGIATTASVENAAWSAETTYLGNLERIEHELLVRLLERAESE
ncbi:MarR family winged helix-turn-helix transcriptional regulator [Gammaproteobacteria bacterium]|nr:MarR family winged helix-turn-helix transcriptional regulator [Gammaproteobacteria bacterium]